MIPSVWEGKFNNFFAAGGPFGGSYFWSTENNKWDLWPGLLDKTAWEGVSISIVGTGIGGGWIGANYWHLGTVGGPSGSNNGSIRELDEDSYQESIKSLNEPIGVLDVDESKITSTPYKEE